MNPILSKIYSEIMRCSKSIELEDSLITNDFYLQPKEETDTPSLDGCDDASCYNI